MSVLPFVAASLAILLTPGPTNTILAASGAAMGLRRALHLPLAEALGYAVAVSLFLVLQEQLGAMPAALAVMKAIASAWLLFSALRLWWQPVVPDFKARQGAFWRVLLTTMLNPRRCWSAPSSSRVWWREAQPAAWPCSSCSRPWPASAGRPWARHFRQFFVSTRTEQRP